MPVTEVAAVALLEPTAALAEPAAAVTEVAAVATTETATAVTTTETAIAVATTETATAVPTTETATAVAATATATATESTATTHATASHASTPHAAAAGRGCYAGDQQERQDCDAAERGEMVACGTQRKNRVCHDVQSNGLAIGRTRDFPLAQARPSGDFVRAPRALV
jgi:hypothetical protein